MSMHTKPRFMFSKTCRECNAPFKSSSKTSLYCITCRPIVRVRKLKQTRERRKVELASHKRLNPTKTLSNINQKWLVRGKPSESGNTDGISNGSF